MKAIASGDIIFARYRIERKLGSGGTGCVYLCTDLKLDTKLAIKVLNNQSKNKETCKLEQDALKLLNHRGLPQVIDIFQDDCSTYIIESFIDGTPLDVLIRKHHSFNEKQVVEWSLQICEALSYLHSLQPNPIIHRDIKPSNIIITKDSRAVLVDFGSSIKYTGKYYPDDTVMGTSIYSAPEQLIIGGISDYRTDIYCLGAMMYQLLSGNLPGSTMHEEITKNSNLSKRINSIIIKCIEMDKLKRYDNVEELINVLETQYSFIISQMVFDEKAIRIIPIIIGFLSLITYIIAAIGVCL